MCSKIKGGDWRGERQPLLCTGRLRELAAATAFLRCAGENSGISVWEIQARGVTNVSDVSIFQENLCKWPLPQGQLTLTDKGMDTDQSKVAFCLVAIYYLQISDVT